MARNCDFRTFSRNSEFAEEVRQFPARAFAFFAALVGHSYQDLVGGLNVLGFARTRKIGGHPRANAKICVVADFGKKVQGIHVGVVNEVEHGLSPNPGIGIFQQSFDGGPHELVANGGENGDSFLADFGRRMVQQTANHGVSDALAFHLEEAESVEDLPWIGGEDLSRQQICGGAIEGKC